MTSTIPFHVPYYGQLAEQKIANALAGRSNHGSGELVQALERRMERLLFGPDIDPLSKTVMMTPSCTSALEISARAIDLKPGDEFIVPGYTFLSTAAAFALTGAKPVFVDVDPETLCMNASHVSNAITPRTKAIVPVHYGGQSPDMEQLMAIASAHNLYVIEDAAQAFMCDFKGQASGTIGHLSCFSFHDSKVFSTGEGGMLVVNDKDLIHRTARIRDKGTNRREFLAGKVDKYGWASQGTSGFVSGVSMSLLDAQLDEREDIISRRQRLLITYVDRLTDTLRAHGWGSMQLRQDENLNAHLYWMLAPSGDIRRSFDNFMRENGITTSGHYPALHRSPFASSMGWTPERPLPITDRAEACLTRLPLYFGMTETDQERVINTVLSFLDKPEV